MKSHFIQKFATPAMILFYSQTFVQRPPSKTQFVAVVDRWLQLFGGSFMLLKTKIRIQKWWLLL
jgi:hypothetical protein